MAIKPDALPDLLKRSIKPLYVLVGDEHLLAQEAGDLIRAAARAAGYGGEGERSIFIVDQWFKWGVLRGATQSMGLFAQKNLIELRMPTGKPGRDGAEPLADWAASLDDNTVAIVTLPRLDGTARKSQWFAALQAHGLEVACDTVPRSELPRWIAARMRRHQQTADDDTLAFMAERVEGNLLAAHQEIEKLSLLYPAGRLSLQQVEQVIADVARYDVFKLSEAVLAADAARLLRMLDGLQAEGESPVLVHFQIAQDVRQLIGCKDAMAVGKPAQQALREHGVWGPRQFLFERALPRLDAAALKPLLHEAAAVDLIVKGLPQANLPREPWAALRHLALGVVDVLKGHRRLALAA